MSGHYLGRAPIVEERRAGRERERESSETAGSADTGLNLKSGGGGVEVPGESLTGDTVELWAGTRVGNRKAKLKSDGFARCARSGVAV